MKIKITTITTKITIITTETTIITTMKNKTIITVDN